MKYDPFIGTLTDRAPVGRTSAVPTRRDLLKALGALPLLAGVAGLLPARASASTPSAAELTDQDRGDLKRAENYLNGITTMRARFQQYSSTAGLAFGKNLSAPPGQAARGI